MGPYSIDRSLPPTPELALVGTPLREISAALLSEYTNAAHAWDDEQVAREMRCFLPRLVEAHWRTRWPAHRPIRKPTWKT